MILFFPQYQAGYVPSVIPVGTPALRRLWQGAPGFAEVPLQPIDPDNPQTKNGIRFYEALRLQLLAAKEIIDVAQPDFIVTTGGDCGGSFSSISYTNRKYDGKIGVLWIDAHGDIHSPETSPSGNYHGMVLRHLMGDFEFACPPDLALRPEQIGYLGLRDTEQAEDDVIARHGIPRFGVAEIMKDDAPIDAVVSHFKKHGITHLYLHVDCDVMDEKVFPHVHVPEPDGLTLERLLDLLQKLRARMLVAGCCLTEWAPRTPEAGLDVVKRVYTEGLGLTLPD